ncbi:MAG: UvrD-helicase domain-containing protein [Bacteroidaceae bacterium]|nr:UvrD-helicase domain-containing protein [Bacteroidaceae bacterium]
MEPRFLVFSASAGSGKTFNLAVQYITLLVANGPHEFANTLAVTFTNKATAEMKERILDQLYGIWQGTPASDGCLDAVQAELQQSYNIHINNEEIRRKCGDALTCIMHDYSRFRVSTIDSFFQSVLRNMAHELGLNAHLQVDLSDDSVTEMAVEHLLASLKPNDDALLPWLNDYVESRMDEGKSWDIVRDMKDMARNLFKEVYLSRELSPGNSPLNANNIRKYRSVLTNRLRQIQEHINKEANSLTSWFDNGLLKYADISRGTSIETYARRLRDGDLIAAEFNSYLQKMADSPENMLRKADRKNVSADKMSMLQQVSDRLKSLCTLRDQMLSEVTTLQLLLANLHPLGALGAIDRQIKEENAQANRFSLAHTPILLKKMVEESDAPFVFEKSGTQFRNVMIDEFQDTSRLQWENFKVLLMNNLSNGGMSMIVGDIKQSIYRWRNGDWSILNGLMNGEGKRWNVRTRQLSRNFRSMGNVVDFNNRFFRCAAECMDRLNPDAEFKLTDLYADVAQQVPDVKIGHGHVQIHVMDEPDDEWTRVTMYEMGMKMLELHETYGIPYNEMTILIRLNRHIPLLVEFFAQEFPQLKLVSSEAFRLSYSLAINMLVSALRVISDEDLAQPSSIPLRYLIQHYLIDIKKQSDGVDYLSAKAEDVLGPFMQQLPRLAQMPLYNLCEYIYRLLDLDKIEDQDAYWLCFFDELGKYMTDKPCDLNSFLDYWDTTLYKQNIPSSAVDGISVLTIHSSKGLQFHSVFVPFLDDSFEKDRNDDVLWCTPPNEPENMLGLVPVRATSRMRKSDMAGDYVAEHDARRVDALNVLYVAFTRAEQNLFVWGSQSVAKEPSASSRTLGDVIVEALEMEDILQYDEDEGVWKKGPLEHFIPTGSPADSPLPLKMCSFEGSTDFRQSEPSRKFVAAQSVGDDEYEHELATGSNQSDYIHLGKLFHYVLSQIATVDDLPGVIQRLSDQGVFDSVRQRRQAESLIAKGLRHPQVKAWFQPGLQLFNECSMIVEESGEIRTRRPDRVMMMPDGRIIVVDFKFGNPNPGYITQVQHYMSFMSQMYPEKRVEGYLWFVYNNHVEEVK